VFSVAGSAQSLGRHRRRQRAKGIVRVEVQVAAEDAALLRAVAQVLNDPSRRDEARHLWRERFGVPLLHGRKALLAAAPLDDIDLSRSEDRARVIDL
jgi:hypothetical protein